MCNYVQFYTNISVCNCNSFFLYIWKYWKSVSHLHIPKVILAFNNSFKDKYSSTFRLSHKLKIMIKYNTISNFSKYPNVFHSNQKNHLIKGNSSHYTFFKKLIIIIILTQWILFLIIIILHLILLSIWLWDIFLLKNMLCSCYCFRW